MATVTIDARSPLSSPGSSDEIELEVAFDGARSSDENVAFDDAARTWIAVVLRRAEDVAYFRLAQDSDLKTTGLSMPIQASRSSLPPDTWDALQRDTVVNFSDTSDAHTICGITLSDLVISDVPKPNASVNPALARRPDTAAPVGLADEQDRTAARSHGPAHGRNSDTKTYIYGYFAMAFLYILPPLTVVFLFCAFAGWMVASITFGVIAVMLIFGYAADALITMWRENRGKYGRYCWNPMSKCCDAHGPWRLIAEATVNFGGERSALERANFAVIHGAFFGFLTGLIFSITYMPLVGLPMFLDVNPGVWDASYRSLASYDFREDSKVQTDWAATWTQGIDTLEDPSDLGTVGQSKLQQYCFAPIIIERSGDQFDPINTHFFAAYNDALYFQEDDDEIYKADHLCCGGNWEACDWTEPSEYHYGQPGSYWMRTTLENAPTDEDSVDHAYTVGPDEPGHPVLLQRLINAYTVPVEEDLVKLGYPDFPTNTTSSNPFNFDDVNLEQVVFVKVQSYVLGSFDDWLWSIILGVNISAVVAWPAWFQLWAFFAS